MARTGAPAPHASTAAETRRDAATPKAQWSALAVGRVKPALFLLGMTPFARWIWLGLNNGLTANPVEFLTRSSGTWTLVCLLVTLAITPLRRLTAQPALVRLRRMCGLFAFFYGFQHFMAWVWWDRGFDPGQMLADIGQRPFITVGFVAFVLMAALAATSTQWAMRRLGKRWQRLHRAVYAIGLLAVLHYWWHKAGKNDLEQPMIYAAVLAVLLGWRVAAWWRRRS
jgi:sulfoxide reductase heme-binding subunit YedZ